MGDQKLHFLLVEDSDDHAALTERSLQRSEFPCEVTRVVDGPAALEILRGEKVADGLRRPDVVLLDLKLPGIDGLEVLEQIRADESLASIPVIMLSTSDSEKDRERAYRLRANSYLVKPAHYREFSELLFAVSTYWGRWNRPASSISD